MATKKKQPQLGEPPKTYEEWVETFEGLIFRVERLVEDDRHEDSEIRNIVRKLRRALDVLKAPLPTQGEQG